MKLSVWFMVLATTIPAMSASSNGDVDAYARLEPGLTSESSEQYIRELWQAYLDSDRVYETAAVETRYPEIASDGGYDSERCRVILDTIDDDIRQHKLFLGLHRLAMRCHIVLGQTDEADRRAAFAAKLAEFIAASGKGDSLDSPLWIGMLADVGDFLSFADYESLDRWFDWAGDGEKIVYTVSVRDEETGEDKRLYFDVDYFLSTLERQLIDETSGTPRPDVGLIGRFRHVPVLMLLAENGDVAAMAGLGIWAERQYGRTEINGFIHLMFDYYRTAARAGSRFALSRLATIAAMWENKDIAEEVLPMLLDVADLGMCNLNMRLLSLYDFRLTERYDEELVEVLGDACARSRPSGEFYLEYAKYLDRFEEDYELPYDVVSHYLKKAGDEGNMQGYVFFADRHLFEDPSERNVDEALVLLQRAADAGNAYALNDLGYLYDNGKYLDKDGSKATAAFQRAAELGSAAAMANLAYRYRDGVHVAQDFAAAFHWFLKAAEAGDARGQHETGLAYMFGSGAERDPVKAFEWLSKAAENGNERAWIGLGYAHEMGVGAEIDRQKAKQWYLKAVRKRWALAEINLDLLGAPGHEPFMLRWDKNVYKEIAERAAKGDPEAIYAKGVLYLRGATVTRNEALANEHFIRAVEQGIAYAAYRLADNTGLRVEDTMEHLRRSASLGYGGAAYKLAEFLKGYGKREEALKYYVQAYELGSTYAALDVGRAYEEGWSVEKDMAAALDWYRKGAEGGDCVQCQTELAWAYYNGMGVERNVDKAIELYGAAAESGNSMAIRNLAKIYTTTAEHKNPQLAVEWLLKDAREEDGVALLELGKLYFFNKQLRNLFLARLYLSESASRKNADAMYWLAYVIEESGSEDSEALVEATKFYEASASWGIAAAKNNLAMMYLIGKGVEKDEDEATDLLEEAADEGSDAAMVNLAWCYENGIGVRKQQTKALEWYRKAAEKESRQAVYRLYQLALTDSSAQEAENLRRRLLTMNDDYDDYQERIAIVVPAIIPLESVSSAAEINGGT